MRLFFALLIFISLAHPLGAEVITRDANHYTLRHEASSTLPPDLLWERLIHPETWWAGDHTYSGDAANLSLDAKAGGSWREDWQGGSVEHGRVLAVLDGQMLRLDAPFGPLQGMGVQVVWTITLKPSDTGTLVVFEEVATGSEESGLNAIAAAVDRVKQQAIENLVGTP